MSKNHPSIKNNSEKGSFYTPIQDVMCFVSYIYAFRSLNFKVFHGVLLCFIFIITDAFYLGNCLIVNLERKRYQRESWLAANFHLEYLWP